MNKLDTGTRIGTMVMDHVIMSFVIFIIAAPGVAYDIFQQINNPDPPMLMLGNYYLNIFAFSLYFNKDIYLGRSPAKRILGLQLVDIKTGKPASPLKCLIRNLTTVFWPIEFVVSLINHERRIGDFIAGTKLIVYNPEQHSQKPNLTWIALAIFMSIVITYFAFFYPIELFFDSSERVVDIL